MFYVGADGCKKGWFTVALAEGNNWEVNLFANIDKLWEKYKEVIKRDLNTEILDLIEKKVGVKKSEK